MHTDEFDQLDDQVADTSDYVSVAPALSAAWFGKWMSAVLASSMDAVVVVDSLRQVLLINRETERMFGYEAGEMLGRSFDTLFPARLSRESQAQLHRLVSLSAEGRGTRTKLAWTGLREDGREFLFDAVISPVSMNDEIFLAMILREKPPSRGDRSLSGFAGSELRKLAVSSQQKIEMEKKRFSRELYDDLGQRLSVLKLDLDWLQANLSDSENAIPVRVQQMQHLLDSVIARTKRIAMTLRPPLLDDFGLVPAIEWMVDNFQKRSAITCRLERHDIAIPPENPAESAIIRVIQEGLLNIERHAHATMVNIWIAQTDRQLNVRIEDNGIGLTPADFRKPGCHGLIAMQERVVILGGKIALGNIEPTGFAIQATIPIDQSLDFAASL
ncbi:MAG TPA: PAS domain S-box protein [Paucimonas sp.]|nr:PAS domain S-box protein [Paucimonas sp.]